MREARLQREQGVQKALRREQVREGGGGLCGVTRWTERGWGLVAQQGLWLHPWEANKGSDTCSDMSIN